MKVQKSMTFLMNIGIESLTKTGNQIQWSICKWEGVTPKHHEIKFISGMQVLLYIQKSASLIHKLIWKRGQKSKSMAVLLSPVCTNQERCGRERFSTAVEPHSGCLHPISQSLGSSPSPVPNFSFLLMCTLGGSSNGSGTWGGVCFACRKDNRQLRSLVPGEVAFVKYKSLLLPIFLLFQEHVLPSFIPQS